MYILYFLDLQVRDIVRLPKLLQKNYELSAHLCLNLNQKTKVLNYKHYILLSYGNYMYN